MGLRLSSDNDFSFYLERERERDVGVLGSENFERTARRQKAGISGL